ncbi:MAG: SGNH/GDSL hydrolase family protein [Pirellulaceae bacterium]
MLLLITGLVYRHYWLARPVGDGPAGPAVPEEPFRSVWTDRRVLLLGIGDSITAGFGASRAELSYFSRLVGNPENEYPEMRGRCLSAVLGNLETTNVAVSGSNSIQHLQRIEELPQQDLDIMGLVVMTTGGNDLIHWYGRSAPREGAMYGATWQQAQPWITSFEQRLNRMIDLLEEKFPGGCHIFVGDIYDPTDGVGDALSVFLPRWPDGLKIHAAYNRVIHRCAQQRESVHLVPIHATFLGHGSHCTQFWREHYRPDDPHYWYATNIEDPNDRGYDALRRVFLWEIMYMLPAEAGTETSVPEDAS